MSAGELTELDRQLHDLYERGWIERSTAGHAAAVVFVRKPDGSWRLCYDYRGLNAITEPLVEPLPHIDTLLEQTRGCAFFSKIDLASAYHQIRLRTSDRWKTSFRSQLGQFQWKVVPFGLQGSSSVLMRVMNEAMTEGRKGAGDLHGKGGVPGARGPLYQCVVVYMDDLLIYSPTLEQHVKDVDEVLAILGERNLFAKAPKCEFGRQE